MTDHPMTDPIEAAAFDKAMTQAPCCNPQDCTTLPWKCADCIEAQREFLAAYEAALWRPINEAPINLNVLAYIPNAEHYGPGIYRAARFSFGTGEHWTVNGLHMGRDCGPYNMPVAFRPLPTPPESGKTRLADFSVADFEEQSK